MAVIASIACVFIVSVCVIYMIARKYLLSALWLVIVSRFFSRSAASPDKLKSFKTEFKVRPDDIFILGYSKSGTHWISYIVKSVVASTQGTTDTSATTESAPCVKVLVPKPSEYWETLASPRLLKTHLPYHMMPGGPPHTHTAKYVYVARNPKDIVVSAHHFASYLFQSFGMPRLPWWVTFALFEKGLDPFGPWHAHVLEWWLHRDRPNILFLKYEDMKKDLTGTIRKIADFLGYDHLGSDAIDKLVLQCSFSTMKNDPTVRYLGKPSVYKVNNIAIKLFAHFMKFLDASKEVTENTNGGLLRKGVVGDWKNYFTPRQSNEADKLFHLRMLRDYGLQFDFE